MDKVFLYDDDGVPTSVNHAPLVDAGVWAALERISGLDNGAPGQLVSLTAENATPWAEILESVDWFAEPMDWFTSSLTDEEMDAARAKLSKAA